MNAGGGRVPLLSRKHIITSLFEPKILYVLKRSFRRTTATVCMQVLDIPLLPGGESKRVTDKNKREFVLLATRKRALGGAEQAISAIRSGMWDVIPKNLLSVLLPSEVVGWVDKLETVTRSLVHR